MPFTIAGDWIPTPPEKKENSSSQPSKPVKVRLLKRGKNVVTVILNLNKEDKEMQELASGIKKKLGCGGSVKGEEIEIQGEKVALVQAYLKDKGIKNS
jgi:translation initiation factor 1